MKSIVLPDTLSDLGLHPPAPLAVFDVGAIATYIRKPTGLLVAAFAES
jgi:hypothetical protein